jgi:pimeloyl-ACP methyl ester carboxylesterase
MRKRPGGRPRVAGRNGCWRRCWNHRRRSARRRGTPAGTPEEIARRLFTHRERQPPPPTLDPRQAAKQAAFVWRVFAPPRDPDLEARLPGLAPPTLALFGTRDSLIPPNMGHLYKELIPDCHLVFVYDAIAA